MVAQDQATFGQLKVFGKMPMQRFARWLFYNLLVTTKTIQTKEELKPLLSTRPRCSFVGHPNATIIITLYQYYNNYYYYCIKISICKWCPTINTDFAIFLCSLLELCS